MRFSHTHTNTQTDRQTGRHTHRDTQAQTHTHSQTDTHTHTKTFSKALCRLYCGISSGSYIVWASERRSEGRRNTGHSSFLKRQERFGPVLNYPFEMSGTRPSISWRKRNTWGCVVSPPSARGGRKWFQKPFRNTSERATKCTWEYIRNTLQPFTPSHKNILPPRKTSAAVSVLWSSRRSAKILIKVYSEEMGKHSVVDLVPRCRSSTHPAPHANRRPATNEFC